MFSDTSCAAVLCPGIATMEYREIIGIATQFNPDRGVEEAAPLYGVSVNLCYPHFIQAVRRQIRSDHDQNIRQKIDRMDGTMIGFGSSNFPKKKGGEK